MREDNAASEKKAPFLIPGFGPLQGLRVLSSGNVIAAPYAAQLMGEMGAEVIHIERPGVGDIVRNEGRMNGVLPFWAAAARNRLSMTLELNMKVEESRAIFLELIRQSDIWIESLVWLEKLGITDEMVLEANPKIVILHVSGYGQKEFGGIPEICDRPCFDVIGQAFSGFMSIQGEEGKPYPVTKPTLNDYLTALFAVFGALTGYIKAKETGKGEVVDLAQYEANAAILGHFIMSYTSSGTMIPRTGNQFTNAPYDIYEVAGGKYVAVGTLGKPLYERALKAMDIDPDVHTFRECGVNLAAMNSEKGQELDRVVRAWMKEHTAQEVENIFSKAKVPAATVNTLAEFVKNEHCLSRNNIISYFDEESEKEVTGFNVVPKFKEQPGQIWRGAPKLGQDTDRIMKELLGYTDEQINNLHEQKII
ncbi:CaiB/BaiF CoA transferase family protein [Desulfitobacterium hafniense]|nr:CoA transferase [Desulfitobacterium hafniense]